MKKIIFLSLLLILSNCTLNKVVKHHGVHNLEQKQLKLKVNVSNINDITKIIGPPLTKNEFDNDVLIFIERKTSSSKLRKLGKRTLLVNNVLILEANKKGIIISKKFYDKESMNKIKFDEDITTTNFAQRSFIYNFLTTLRSKIDDPLGKKRAKVN
jgi:outer membrane protein assembly factor BamE (lipoprotein component of BamABCDE complex)